MIDIARPTNATLHSNLLSEQIHTALIANPHVPNNQVNIETDSGRIILKGQVSSFFQKQMAQETVRRIDGVQEIDNMLVVNW